jgi:hypothetical protein
MTLLKRITSIAAFMESTYGSDPGGTPEANYFYCFDLDFTPSMEVIRRNIYRSSLGQVAPRAGAKSAQVSFTAELMGDGTAGNVPPIEKLLKMCGFNETINAARCVGYEPKDPTGSDPLDSGTIYIYQDGIRNIMLGCRGTFSLTCEAGAIANFAFTIDGFTFDWTDVDAPAAQAGVYPTIQPPVVVSAGFAVGSPNLSDKDGPPWSGVVVPSISFDMNNSIARGQSINTASGYKSVEITGRAPTGNMSPEAVLLATHPFYTDWVSGDKADLLWTVGSDSGNRCIISIPAAYYTQITFEERDGILAHPAPFDVCLSGESTTGVADSGSVSTIVDSALFGTTAAEARTYVGRRVTMGYGTANSIDGEIAIITGVTSNTATVSPDFSAAVAVNDDFTISEKELQLLFY